MNNVIATTGRRQFKLFTSRRSGTPLGTPTLSASMMQSSFVLEETELNSVELYGSTLPVTVTEILTLTESELQRSSSFPKIDLKSSFCAILANHFAVNPHPTPTLNTSFCEDNYTN